MSIKPDPRQLAHSEQCVETEVIVSEIDTRARAISPNTLVRFVPAIEDAHKSLESSKSPLQAMIGRLIKEPANDRPELTALRQAVTQTARGIFCPETTPEFIDVQSRVNARLQEFAPGITLQLSWENVGNGIELLTP